MPRSITVFQEIQGESKGVQENIWRMYSPTLLMRLKLGTFLQDDWAELFEMYISFILHCTSISGRFFDGKMCVCVCVCTCVKR